MKLHRERSSDTKLAEKENPMKSNEKRSLVLVTGGAGYVGCHLVPSLLDAGYRVRVFDIMFYGDAGLDRVRDRVEIVEGDIRFCPPGSPPSSTWPASRRNRRRNIVPRPTTRSIFEPQSSLPG
jgi:hypothetical protein